MFIIGCARSGTTLLRDVIASHQDIATIPREANHLWHPTSYPWATAPYTKPPLWADPRTFTRRSLAEWGQDHPARIRGAFEQFLAGSGRTVFLCKSAMIAFMMARVLELFPDARVVHVVRDGRAVAHSYARREFDKMQRSIDIYRARGWDMTFDEMLDRMARTWVAHLNAVDDVVAGQSPASTATIVECRYEELCERPRATAERIISRLDLDPSGLGYSRWDGIESRNDRFRRELEPARQRRVETLQASALRRRGYAVPFM